MTNDDIIDKWIDQQRITSGNWEYQEGEDGFVVLSENSRIALACYVKKEDGKVMANSRESLHDWIAQAFETEKILDFTFNCFERAINNIFIETGKKWSQVKKELEELVDE